MRASTVMQRLTDWWLRDIPDFRELVRTKFATDSLYNLASLGFLAAFGLFFNILIAAYHTPHVLGTFNLSYAVYMLTAQVATLGVQISTLKHIAESPDDIPRCSVIISSALLVCALAAAFFALALYLSRGVCARALNSPDLAASLVFVIPGFFFFVLNKVSLNALNGLRKMKAYSLFVTARYALLLITLIVLLIMGSPGYALTAVFSVAETLLFAALIFHCKRLLSFSRISSLSVWIRTHLLFGLRGHLGMIAERLNTRIDVLVLGVLTSDYYVGLYSFAAMIVEGLNQIPGVFRMNTDPILSRLSIQDRKDEIARIVSQWGKWSILLMSIGGLVLTISFPYVVETLVRRSDFYLSFSVLFILISGAILQSAYTPFTGILVQSGFPGLHSLLIGASSLTILLVSLLFVPLWDINGTALAVASANLVFVIGMKTLSYRALGIRI